jgi:hypothetical protein
MSDQILNEVIENFKKRSIIGYLKYGVTMDRNDLTYLEWINHLQEELMDATLYLQKIKQTTNEIKRLSDSDKG